MVMSTKIIFIFVSLVILNWKDTRQDDTQDNSQLVQDTSNSQITEDDSTGVINGARKMRAARAAHSATLLKNGKVLIAGGFSGSTLSEAEIYDPALKTFRSVGQMSVERSGHSATILPDGKVLIAGGYNGNYLSSTE